MNPSDETFSFPSARRLYRYLGETDAMVELTELACRSFLDAARTSGNVPQFLSTETGKYGIHVNLSEIDTLSRHLARTYIVLVASAVERFLKDFRKEHCALYSAEWKGDANNKDRLEIVFVNVVRSERKAEEQIGVDIVGRLQYYRRLRNWIVHDQESNPQVPKETFDALAPLTDANNNLYRSLNAPNAPSALTFDDFILFSRLAKRVAEELCLIAKPAPEHWGKFLDLSPFRKFRQNPKRMKNAICGKIRTDFGFDSSTAAWIADNIMAH